MDKPKEYKGYNGSIVLTDNGVIIKRGLAGILLGHGLKGDKTIPYSSITAIQLKKAGLTAGYLQLSMQGGIESRGGLFKATRDENTIMFSNWDNKKFEEAKSIIEKRINGTGQQTSNELNDLEKLAELKKKGIITEEEFSKKKKIILGI